MWKRNTWTVRVITRRSSYRVFLLAKLFIVRSNNCDDVRLCSRLRSKQLGQCRQQAERTLQTKG